MSKQLTSTGFISHTKKVHGDEYDYSMVDYYDSRSTVNIICYEHGMFEMEAFKHIQGQGCPVCTQEKKQPVKFYRGGNKSQTTEQFIEKAKNRYGDEYIYTSVKYVNDRTPIDIICRRHGVFTRTPNYFMYGSGCPTCIKNRI